MDFFDHGSAGGKALIDVLTGNEPWRRPIWLMRQAGRYLPEYRQVRAQAGSFLDLCYAPELAAEVTLQPLRRFDLDAAIIFADILLIPQALGVDLAFKENEGPKLAVVRDGSGVRQLKLDGAVDKLGVVFEALQRVRSELPAHVGLIGFCGAPWTVATYIVEGGTSPDRRNTKLAAFSNDGWFDDLIDMLVDSSVEYLCRQIDAGAEAVQIFDTWAGDLPDGLREKYCFEPISRIVAGVKAVHPAVPVIGFARGVGAAHLAFAKATGVDAVGVEWSAPLDWISGELAPVVPVQGNLDPFCLIAGGDALREGVTRITSAVRPGRHIMNLGHGIRPETPPEHVAELVDLVREQDQERAG